MKTVIRKKVTPHPECGMYILNSFKAASVDTVYEEIDKIDIQARNISYDERECMKAAHSMYADIFEDGQDRSKDASCCIHPAEGQNSSAKKVSVESMGRGHGTRGKLCCIIFLFLLCLAFIFASFVFTSFKVFTLKSEVASLQHMLASLLQNDSLAIVGVRKELDQLNQNYSRDVAQLLKYLSFQGQQPTKPVPSCTALLTFFPNISSGYYWVRTSSGSVKCVYCDMTRSCGGMDQSDQTDCDQHHHSVSWATPTEE